MDKFTVYVLKLEHDCYYVGMTTSFVNRMFQHFNGLGSEWTKFHKPLEILIRVETTDKNLERELTISFASKYSWARVRGADWTAISLTSQVRYKPLPKLKQLETIKYGHRNDTSNININDTGSSVNSVTSID